MEKKCLLAFWVEKTPLKTTKTSVYKELKIRFFSNRVDPLFLSKKLEIYSTFSVIKKRQRKSLSARCS